MKWQQGKIMNDYDHEHLVGRVIWVEIGKPREPDGQVHWGPKGDFVDVEQSYRTNMEWMDARLLVRKNGIELTNVFAEDVRIITYEQFLAGDDGTKD